MDAAFDREYASVERSILIGESCRRSLFHLKLLIHVVLAVSLAVLVVLQSQFDQEYVRTMHRSFRFFFLAKDHEESADTHDFYEIDSAVESVRWAVQNYYDLSWNSVMDISFVAEGSNTCVPYTIDADIDDGATSDAALGFPEQNDILADPGTSADDDWHFKDDDGGPISVDDDTSYTTIREPQLAVHFSDGRDSVTCAFASPVLDLVDAPKHIKRDSAVDDFFKHCAPLSSEASRLDTFAHMASMTLSMKLCSSMKQPEQTFRNQGTYLWEVSLEYRFSLPGVLTESVKDSVKEMQGGETTLAGYVDEDYNVVLLFVLSAAAVNLVLAAIACQRSFYMYRRIRDAHKAACSRLMVDTKHDPNAYASRVIVRPALAYSWSELPPGVRSKLLQPWLCAAAGGDALLVIASSFYLDMRLNFTPSRGAIQMALGVGVLCCFATLMREVKGTPGVRTFTLSIAYGLPRVLETLVNMLPVFLCFAFFGSIYFGAKVSLFTGASTTVSTLFSLVNGNNIYETFVELSGYFHIAGPLYLYAFVGTFTIVVLNVLTVVIEEGYFASATNKRGLEKYRPAYFPAKHEGASAGGVNKPDSATTTFASICIFVDQISLVESQMAEAQR